jgi:hypothetical protein
MKMTCYLEMNMKDFLYCVCIFGSLATNEQISYSDFDGLVIIDDTKYSSKELKKCHKLLKKSEKIIYQIDPLQHHGWFIINKSRLSNYPQNYFPFEIFEYSKSLMGDSIEFEINLQEKTDYFTPFLKLKNHLLAIMDKRPNNLYQLKSFLSGLMLMPSLYLQAKSKKGCNKKYSFDVAGKDFTEKEWQSIETASYIRKIWRYNLNPVQKFIMTRNGKYFRKFTKLFISPKIPSEYKKLLNEDFYSNVTLLLEKMNSNINALN